MKRSAAFLVLCFAVTMPAAHAAPPSNDARASAAKINALPAASFVFLSQATSEPGEDTSCTGSRTVWYSWRAKTADPLTVSVQDQGPMGGSFATQVYKKVRSQLVPVVCGGNTFTFTPEPDTNYIFQIGGNAPLPNIHWSIAPGAGSTMATAEHIVAPPLPFSEIVGLLGGLGADPAPTCGVANGSNWYAYTADTARVLTYHIDAMEPAYIQLYDGSGTPIPGACRSTLNPHEGADIILPQLAGQTVFVQYGHNVEPGANYGSNIAIGFVSLSVPA